jgi:hypothetical protein
MKKLLEAMRKLDEAPRHKSKKTLYHIGPKPAEPKEKMRPLMDFDPDAIDRKTGEKGDFVPIPGTANWERHWLKEPVKNAVFLTPDPVAIGMNHGVHGNVYAYRVPQWVIAAAGGIHRYDHGSEIVISKEIWDQAGDEIEFLGKSMDAAELTNRINKGSSESHPGPSAYYLNQRGIDARMALEDPESKIDRADTKLWIGLHKTRYPESAIKAMSPEDRARALRSFERWIKKYNPFQGLPAPEKTTYIMNLLKGKQQ